MGIEFRHGRVYYYRKRRVGAKVVSEYVGHGMMAHYAFLQDSQEREQRDEQRCTLERLTQEQDGIDRALDEYGDQVRQLVATGLQALGYHRHKRQWRLKRTKERIGMANEVVSIGQRIKEYNELLQAARKDRPSADALDQLQNYGFAHPEIFERMNMLGRTTLKDIIEHTSIDKASQTHMYAETRAMEDTLGIDDAFPLEKLMIRHVALCWLRMNMMEQTYTHNCMGGAGISQATALYLEKRLSAAHHRYLKAAEALVRVRGLLQRAGVQVNVANQMVVQNG